MKNVFISYSSKNYDIADKICTYLEERGKQCWIAPRNIPIGTEYGEEIIKGLESSSVVVLIFSEYSNQSQHVLREVERAVSKNIPIISYRVDQAVLTKSMEYFLLTNQWLDATKEPSKMLAKLDEGISVLLGEKSETGTYEAEKIPEKVEASKKYKRPIIAAASLGTLIVATVLVFPLFAGKKNSGSEEVNNNQVMLVSESEPTTAVHEPPEKATDVPQAETAAPEPTIETTPTEAPVKEENIEEDGKESVNQEPKQEEKKESESEEENNQEKATENTEKNQEDTKKETKEGATKDTSKETEKKENTKDTSKETEKKDTTEDVGKESEKKEVVTQEPEVTKLDVVAGEYITFGKYQPVGSTGGDGTIVWQVLDVDNTTNQVKLIAEQILDIKPFDCADSGRYDVTVDGQKYDRSKLDEYSKEELIQFRGNGDWAQSDLRAWLNAEENVKYPGVEPTDAGTDECGNAFNNQKGFLNRFTKAEKRLIQATQLEDGSMNKVYLLSVDEVKKYEKTDYFQLHPSITEAAVESDITSWYATYKANGATDYIWATRTMSENYPQQIYVVNSAVGKETFVEKNAAAAGHGIRPVLSISLDGLKLDGEGSSSNPYQIIFE